MNKYAKSQWKSVFLLETTLVNIIWSSIIWQKYYEYKIQKIHTQNYNVISMWIIFIKTIIEKHTSEFSYIVFFINIFFHKSNHGWISGVTISKPISSAVGCGFFRAQVSSNQKLQNLNFMLLPISTQH